VDTTIDRSCRWVAVVALLAPVALGAQTVPEFNKMRTPSSPAFVVLGISPSVISRPNTPSTFATSFLEDFNTGSTLLPRSFALETTPYWWSSRPGLTLDEYESASRENLYRNLSLSVAVTDSASDGTASADVRRLGIGLRTSIVSGTTVDRSCIVNVTRVATAVSGAVAAGVAGAIARGEVDAGDPSALETLRGRLYSAAVDALPEQDRSILEAESESCVNTLSAKKGFLLDAAIAAAGRFPGGRADRGELSSFGLWVTPALAGTAGSAVGVARVLWNDLDTDSTRTSIDLGFKGIHAAGAHAVSLEAVWRHTSRQGDSDELFRVSATFDLKLVDKTWISLSFGKDFDSQSANSLFTLANLSWQLGDRAIKPKM